MVLSVLSYYELLFVLCIIQYSIATVYTVYMEDYLSLLSATEIGRSITYNYSNIVELAAQFPKYVGSAISEVILHNILHVHFMLLINEPLLDSQIEDLEYLDDKVKLQVISQISEPYM